MCSSGKHATAATKAMVLPPLQRQLTGSGELSPFGRESVNRQLDATNTNSNSGFQPFLELQSLPT